MIGILRESPVFVDGPIVRGATDSGKSAETPTPGPRKLVQCRTWTQYGWVGVAFVSRPWPN